MSVYVDDLFDARPFNSPTWPYAQACHLTADTLPELHAFARKLGLKRTWFQDYRPHQHYDLTAGKRGQAVGLGAVEIDALTQRTHLRATRANTAKQLVLF